MTTQVKLTQHAIRRMQQRGISQQAIDLLLRYGSRSVPRGSRLTALSASVEDCRTALAEGVSVAAIDQLARLIVLVDEVDSAVITAFKAGHTGTRQYRRPVMARRRCGRSPRYGR
jgi:hypothetical protein